MNITTKAPTLAWHRFTPVGATVDIDPEKVKPDFAAGLRGRCITWFTSASVLESPENVLREMTAWVASRPHDLLVLFYGVPGGPVHPRPSDYENSAANVLISHWNHMDYIKDIAPHGYIGRAISMPQGLPEGTIKHFQEGCIAVHSAKQHDFM